MFLADDVAQFRCGNQNLGIGIIHQQVQSLRWIGGIQWQICAASLQNAQGADHHIFAPGNQHTYNLLPLNSAPAQVHGEPVRDFIQLSICIFFVQIHQRSVPRAQTRLIAEEINHSLFLVEGEFRPVEGFNLISSSLISQLHIIYIFLREEFLRNLCVCTGHIFGKAAAEHILTVAHMDFIPAFAQLGQFNQDGGIFNMPFIIDALSPDARTIHHPVIQYASLVAEADIRSHAVFCSDFRKGIQVVLPAFSQLLRRLLQHIPNGRITAEVGDKGQGLDQHGQCVFRLLGFTAVVDGGNHTVVAVIVFRSQESHHTGKEGRGGNSRLPAESLERRLVHLELVP